MAWWDSDDIKKTIKSWWSDIPNVTITKDNPGQGNMSGGVSDLVKANITEQDIDTPELRKQQIIDFFKDKGYSTKAIAGIVGNMHVETGGTYDYLEKQNKGKGKGIGIIQMTDTEMYKAYTDWLSKNERQDSLDSQLVYTDQLIQGTDKSNPKYPGEPYLGRDEASKIKKILTNPDISVKDATLAFQDYVEKPSKPHTDRRLKAANEYYGKDLYNEAQKAYPYLRDRDIDYVYNPDDNPKSGFLEFWEPGDEGPPDGSVKRPAGISLDKYGIEIRKEATRPIDILGDYASHLGVKYDPTLKKIYEDYSSSLDEKQLKDRYEMEKERYGENRDYNLWAERSGIPGLFRGYTFDQFPDDVKTKLYTPDQMKILDRAKEYLDVEMKPLNVSD